METINKMKNKGSMVFLGIFLALLASSQMADKSSDMSVKDIIGDKRNESLDVFPGTVFCTYRNFSGDELTVSPLFSPDLTLVSMDRVVRGVEQYELGGVPIMGICGELYNLGTDDTRENCERNSSCHFVNESCFCEASYTYPCQKGMERVMGERETVSYLDVRDGVFNAPATDKEKEVYAVKQLLPQSAKELTFTGVSKKIAGGEMRFCFMAPSLEDIRSGKGSSGRISYQAYNPEGYDVCTSSWWNVSYPYSKSLSIQNNDPDDDLPQNYTLNFTIDTSSLVSAGKMQPDCDDLRIVYANATDLDRLVHDCNSTSTIVEFALQNNVTKNTADGSNYTLYYGSSSTANPPRDELKVYIGWENCSDVSDWSNGGASTMTWESNAGRCHGYDNAGVGRFFKYKTFLTEPGVSKFRARFNVYVDTSTATTGIFYVRFYSPAYSSTYSHGYDLGWLNDGGDSWNYQRYSDWAWTEFPTTVDLADDTTYSMLYECGTNATSPNTACSFYLDGFVKGSGLYYIKPFGTIDIRSRDETGESGISDVYFDNFTIMHWVENAPTITLGGESDILPQLNVSLVSPQNDTETSDPTPDFTYVVSGRNATYACTLYLNDTPYGTDGSAQNNTPTVQTANATLMDGQYLWNADCSSGLMVNNSVQYLITINAGSVCGMGSNCSACSGWTNISVTGGTVQARDGDENGKYDMICCGGTVSNYTSV